MTQHPINPFEASDTNTWTPEESPNQNVPPTGIMVIGIVFTLFGFVGIITGLIGLIQMFVMMSVTATNKIPADMIAIQFSAGMASEAGEADASSAIAFQQPNGQQQAQDYQAEVEDWAKGFQQVSWVQIPSMLLNVIVSFMMITAGIGLLLKRLWAAKLGVIVSYLNIFSYALGLVLTAVVMPGMWDKMQNMPDPPGAGGAPIDMKSVVVVSMMVGIGISIVMTIVFCFLYWWIAGYLKRPNVRYHLR